MDTDQTTVTRVLAVADWAVEPEAVVAAMRRRADTEPTIFGLLVPAWLHGLDWAGDPTAAVPCAELQLDTLERLCGDAGLLVGAAWIGDPDPATAGGDVLLGEWPADHVLTAPDVAAAPSPAVALNQPVNPNADQEEDMSTIAATLRPIPFPSSTA